MKRRLSVVLPVTMSVISLPLVIWDIYNRRIIIAMGMAWDTGAPLWPYQTSHILLATFHTPAFVLFTPCIHALSFFTGLFMSLLQLAFLLPAIFLWWWLVGKFFDGWRSRIGTQRGWVITSLLPFGAILLGWLGIAGAIDTVRWWWTYSREIFGISDLIVLRSVAPCLWCFALCFVALDLIRRRFAKRVQAPAA